MNKAVLNGIKLVKKILLVLYFFNISGFVKNLTAYVLFFNHSVFCSRFIEVEEIHEPKLIVVVGALGLVVNIIGLFLFAG